MVIYMINIGNRRIAEDTPPYFIADIAANHDGELSRAYHLIEFAKAAGADAAKFQNFTAATIVSRNGFDSLGGRLSHQASWNKSVYEVYEQYSIEKEWTQLLKLKCEEVGIEYLTTPYDLTTVKEVAPYVNAFKVGSGDITWIELIETIAAHKKPVLLATGASTLEEVERAVQAIRAFHSRVVVMQCNTNYIASSSNFNYINLNVLKTYARQYPDLILGLSDHTPGDVTVLGAIALGARVIEKHFTDDNSRSGPDHTFAMNPVTWREMVSRSRDLWAALGDGVKRIEGNEAETARIQKRSLYYRNNKESGSILVKEDVHPLRPMNPAGISPHNLEDILGKKLKKQVDKDTCIKWEDFE